MVAPDRFTTTRWTIVLAAKHRDDPSGSDAFARLCKRYYEPLYAYLRRNGRTASDAEDLTQGFMTRLIEKDILRHADPARGRFRSFLLTALKHYAVNEHVRAAAVKRGGRQLSPALDFEAVERRVIEPRDDLTPERLYDRRWALAVLERALSVLRDECRTSGREAFFDAVHGSFTGDADRARYRDVAERFGMTEPSVRVAVHRLRLRYRELVRAEVADTVESDEAVDEELRYLQAILSA
jgi:RNA polymerase sigma-70 factor (ECF subfamily)